MLEFFITLLLIDRIRAFDYGPYERAIGRAHPLEQESRLEQESPAICVRARRNQPPPNALFDHPSVLRRARMALALGVVIEP